MIQHKLKILSQIAELFQQNHITWAVGGSLLLYLKGIVDNFNDIDIMILAEDAQKARKLLMNIGEEQKLKQANPYKSDHFYVFLVEEVEVDLMGGFLIEKEDGMHGCFLRKEDICETVIVNQERIPLHSLMEWRRYYKLMGRDDKVKLLENI